MNGMSLLKIMALAAYVVCVCTGDDDVYVSHSGSNTPLCGPSAQPCATLRYALAHRPNATQIYIDSSSGAYTEEAGTEYMLADHDLTLSGSGPHPAVIQCTDNQHTKLFHFSPAPHHGPIKVGIENLSIRNCRGNHSSVMILNNTQLSLSNSQFTNNGLLLYHSQIADDNCSFISVDIKNCNFTNDLRSRPFYVPAVELAGCDQVELTVFKSQFQTSPIVVNAELNSNIRLNSVLLSGAELRGSSLAITLGQGNNSISFTDCTVTGHQASHSSPVSISTNTSPHSAAIKLRRVRFHDNQRQKTGGAALSLFARFVRQSAPPLNVSLFDCIFANNSVDHWQLGGAVFVSSVATVNFYRCAFVSNVASNGAAIYLYSSSDVTLTDCVFTANSAVNQRQASYASRGGALFAESSQIQLVDCTFTNNTSQHVGSAVYVTDATGVSLIRCVFTESAATMPGPENAMLSISAGRAESSAPVIKLTDCLLQSPIHHEHVLVSMCGPININNSSVSCHSDAMSLRHASIPAALHSASYEMEQLSVWSQPACSGGYYAPLRSTRCHLVLHGRLTDLNDSAQIMCYACSAHAQCSDAVVHPDYNYYLLATDDGRAEAVLCPEGYCQPRNSSGMLACTEGRTGHVCSGCDNEHVASLHFNDHVSCDSHASCISYTGTSVTILCFTLFYVVVLLLLLRLSTRQSRHTTPHRVTSATSTRVPANRNHVTTTCSLIGCVLSIAYFFQLLPSVYPRLMTSSWWLDRIIQFFTSLFHLYPAVFAAGRGFCLSELTDQPSSIAVQRYFFTMSIYWSQLALIVLLFCPFAAVFLCNRGPFTEQNIKMLVSYFLSAFVFFQLLSNVPLLRSSLQSVHCVTYNDSSVLFTDAMTSCFASWQVFSVLYVIVCVAPLCLVIDTAAFTLSRGRLSVLGYVGVSLFPLFGLVVVPLNNLRAAWATRNRSRTSDDVQENRDEFEVDETTPEGLRTVPAHSVVIVQSVVIKPFNSYFSSSFLDVGFMTVILLRNFLITTLSSLLHHVPSVRSIVVTVLCLFFAVDQLACRCYSLPAANWIATTSLMMLTLLSIFDIYASMVYDSGQPLSVWSPVDWLARLVASLPIIIMIVLIIVFITRAIFRRAVRYRGTRPL